MKIKHLWQLKCARLQIKVDAALQEIAGATRWISEDTDNYDAEWIKGAVLRALERMEIILQSNKTKHNTSCTYQFELAFHNLQDTPELRKIYWSALGQLRFDSNDRVIPPELEECPCCNANIRKIGTETEGYETYDIGVDESGSRYIRYRLGEWELEE